MDGQKLRIAGGPNGNHPSAAVFAFAVAGAWAAGALTARFIVRREIGKVHSNGQNGTARVQAVTQPPLVQMPHLPIARAEPPQVSQEISEEILSVLSAAVAAFLGKKARIRAVRPLHAPVHSSAWVQQGRFYAQGWDWF